MKDKKYIRAGFFEDFKGEDSILISVDIFGLTELEMVFDRLAKSETEINISKLKYIDKVYQIPIKMRATEKNYGLVNKNGKYEWCLTKKKWDKFRQQVIHLYLNGTSGHLYLDSESKDNKDLQINISLSEYDKSFWAKK